MMLQLPAWSVQKRPEKDFFFQSRSKGQRILRHGNILIFSFTLDGETSIERLETDGLLGGKVLRRLKPLAAITCARRNKKCFFFRDHSKLTFMDFNDRKTFAINTV